MEVQPYTEVFHVRSYEADVQARASMSTLCNYLQEVASNHAYRLALSVEQLAEARLTWVLARLHVRVERYPGWRDAVTAETWPSGEDGLYATREFILRDGSGATIGTGTSAWLLVDTERRKPVRIPPFVSALRLPQRGAPLTDVPRKLDAPAETHATHRFPVRVADLDMNAHVNNVHYVEWALEAAQADQPESASPTALDIAFRAETMPGDTVCVDTAPPDAEGAVLQKLTRESDGRLVAVVRTVWPAP